MTASIRVLTPQEAQQRRGELEALLVDGVTHGASVNFTWPMTGEKAGRWWNGALDSHARGERLILVAEREGLLVGSVQLVLAGQENQPHRADIAKLLVHSTARRQRIGAALMQAAEQEAERLGRVLLTLDTESGSDGERLYERLGWTRFGVVPGFALRADGSELQAASFFFKRLQSASVQ